MRPAPATRLIGAIVVLLAVALGCSTVVDGNGTPASPPPPQSASSSGSTGDFPSGSTASSPASPSGSGSSTANQGVPATCPVVDRRAGLQFDCLRSGMTNLPAQGYPTQIVYQTESNPSWYMSELTQLRKTQSGLKTSVGGALIEFVSGSYPQGSKGKSVTEKATKLDGRDAYIVDGRVTIAKTGDDTRLKAVQDRVLLVAVSRPGNVASMLIIAVPDTAKTLWPTMDRIAAGVKLV